MGILLLAILIAFSIIQVITNTFLRIEEGSPAKDKDILEMLEKSGDKYDRIRNGYDDNFFIQATSNFDVPSITKNKKWLFAYYPYTINGVGVVPRWYKSRKIIDTKFVELLKDSEYNTNKRKKLGLE